MNGSQISAQFESHGSGVLYAIGDQQLVEAADQVLAAFLTVNGVDAADQIMNDPWRSDHPVPDASFMVTITLEPHPERLGTFTPTVESTGGGVDEALGALQLLVSDRVRYCGPFGVFVGDALWLHSIAGYYSCGDDLLVSLDELAARFYPALPPSLNAKAEISAR